MARKHAGPTVWVPIPFWGWGQGHDTVARQEETQGQLTVHGNSTDDILTQVLLYRKTG
jgi:hypothetical protein